MAQSADSYRVTVLGTFAIHDPEGCDITPTGAKPQALLALLVLSPHLSRPRRWLEDKLWSTFGAEQASANLRQALSKIRETLGANKDMLVADRMTVSLDPDRLLIDLKENGPPLDERVELLQGLDVRDPEFEDWLRMERAELRSRMAQAIPRAATGVLIHCSAEADTGARDRTMGDILANQIGENITEHVRAWRQADSAVLAPDGQPADLSISCQVIEQSEGHSVFIRAIQDSSGRILYSKLLHLKTLEDILTTQEQIAKTVFEAADQITGKLPQVLSSDRPETRCTALSRLALYRMFSFERDALAEAYNLMQKAYEIDDNGVYLAWLAQIRIIQMMELDMSDRPALSAEATELQYKALEQAGHNPLVQSIASGIRGMTLRDTEGSLQLARAAVEANPASAYAWEALAEANMAAGRLEDALRNSGRARRIAASSPFRHWFDIGHCIIAIACGKPAEAIEAGEAAARAAPLSRPAHRHLLALYALDGRLDKAQEIADKLTKIEPGFSLDRIVNDETYPVRTLRKQGMLEALRALL